jgi:hypothetical protein
MRQGLWRLPIFTQSAKLLMVILVRFAESVASETQPIQDVVAITKAPWTTFRCTYPASYSRTSIDHEAICRRAVVVERQVSMIAHLINNRTICSEGYASTLGGGVLTGSLLHASNTLASDRLFSISPAASCDARRFRSALYSLCLCNAANIIHCCLLSCPTFRTFLFCLRSVFTSHCKLYVDAHAWLIDWISDRYNNIYNCCCLGSAMSIAVLIPGYISTDGTNFGSTFIHCGSFWPTFAFRFRGRKQRWSWGGSVNIMSDYMLGDRDSIPDRGKGYFLQPLCPDQALRPTQPPIQWVSGVVSPEVKHCRGVTLTTFPI